MLTVCAVFASILFIDCRQNEGKNFQNQKTAEPDLPVQKKPISIVSGSRVYVPAYARAFSYRNEQTVPLVTTLAVHNTDMEHPIFLRKIEYYSEGGRLLKEYMKEPRILGPMATAVYPLVPEKEGAGIGANAVVEWVSEHKVSRPVIEAIMISEGTLGISFITPGYSIKKITE